jgi:hypothetical protein
VAIAAAFILVFDAAVVVVPQALADHGSASRGAGALIAEAATQSVLAAAADPTPFATPFVVPTPPPAPAATPTPKPKPSARAILIYRDTVANARLYIKGQIGIKQYNCIDLLFQHESKWNPRAMFPSSGNPSTASYGIPQAHPGSKMAAFGSNWRTSPLTQVKWGIWYVNSRYGSACGAEAFKKLHGWY